MNKNIAVKAYNGDGEYDQELSSLPLFKDDMDRRDQQQLRFA